MKQDMWIQLVKWVLWGLTMAVMIGWVAKSRLRKRPESERNLLRHPVSTLVIGIVGVAFFFGIVIGSNTVWKNQTSTIWTTVMFIAFGLLPAPLIADYLFARHRVSDTGIEYGRMLGQRGSLNWLDVRKLRYAPVLKWFELDGPSGEKVRVSAMLLGLPEFAHFVLLHVPGQAIDEKTLAILRETEQGRPPSVWK
ncbi:PH domain-containing protein [Pseudoduganella violaceinigra]|uniref:PH domain-containing protein n=1 Tax=Pseudoduganella violaceinigra TaxID=246602 RepID=UPI0013783B90|nr:PH domain-containing protein [Pseudoduganella violaceinigra]